MVNRRFKLALHESPALILMDIGLPKRDGLVVIEQLRKRRRLRGVPIDAVTAYDSPGLVLKRKKQGSVTISPSLRIPRNLAA